MTDIEAFADLPQSSRATTVLRQAFIWLVFVFVVALTAVFPANAMPTPSCAADRRADLAELPDLLAGTHPAPFLHRPRPAFESDLRILADQAADLSEEAFTIQLGRLIATLGDSHTLVHLPPGYQPLPLSLYAFEEGIYAVAAARPYERAVGCRLVQIEGHPVAEVTAKLAGMVPAGTPAMVLKTAPAYMVIPAVLRGNALSERAGQVARYTFQDAKGTTFELAVAESQAELTFARHPDLVPAWGRRRDPYWLATPGDALYLNFRQCRDNPKRPFEGFIRDAFQLAAQRGLKRVIVDLRENGGGNSRVVGPLVDACERFARGHPAPALVVLIGRRTFSSGLLAALDLKQKAGATLLGEETSGKPNHFGEVRELRLPRTGLVLSCATKSFRRVAGDPATLKPDQPIPTRARDFFQAVDAVLEAAAKAEGTSP